MLAAPEESKILGEDEPSGHSAVVGAAICAWCCTALFSMREARTSRCSGVAAAKLGIGLRTLYEKLKKYGLR
jgi:DNA-binding NtrC family response regulator